jgi:hypothetical protein
MAIVEKMSENFHAELQHKDVRLAVLEAKLCQVQLQLEESKLASEMALSDKSEEEVHLHILYNVRWCWTRIVKDTHLN